MNEGRKLLPALFVFLAIFCAAEEVRWAGICAVACALLNLALARPGLVPGVFTVATSGLVAWLGPVALPLLALVILPGSFGAAGGVACASSIALASVLAPQLTVFCASLDARLASAASAIMAPLLCSLALVTVAPVGARGKALVRAATLCAAAAATLWVVLVGTGIGPDMLSHPFSRAAFGVALVAVGATGSGTGVAFGTQPSLRLASVALLSAGTTAWFASQGDPVATIVFDEAHGEWASTTLPLGPDDFGRSTTYSWRALANVLQASGVAVERRTEARTFVPASRDALYVLKMPVDAIDPQFAKELLAWVGTGGRLLVVADHTDLFDTTQNLNAVLESLGIRIAPTAVFDRLGQPPVVPRAHWSGPDWMRPELDHRYLTGSSFERLPWAALSVHTYGMSFAEQAVYFKANRFGYFSPGLSHPYGNHPVVVMLAHGAGTIQVWLDSTHWSTFTAFHSSYQDDFWQAMNRSGLQRAARLYPYALAALALLAAGLILLPRAPVPLHMGVALVLGVLLGATASARLVDGSPLLPSRSVSVAIGQSASVELLTPIVESASRNYPRALASLQKWAPVRLHPSASRALDATGASVVLIDLDPGELPTASRVLEWVQAGKRVVILSDQRLLTLVEHQRWLRELGFVLRAERNLAAERDVSSDLLGRREPVLARHASVRFATTGSSMWTETESMQLAQFFVLRPSPHRMASPTGLLVLSSRSEQFSDAAMGEVWDGVPADDLSRARERQFARLVIGESVPEIELDLVDAPRVRRPAASNLDLPSRFIVVSQGRVQAEGTLSEASPGEELSLAETPDAFVWRLREEAASFMPSCRVDPANGYCSRTLVDSRLVEWLVVPELDPRGRIQRLELIHEGRLSGVREGINVVLE